MPRRCNWASQCTDYFFGLTIKKRRIGVVDVNDNIILQIKDILLSTLLCTWKKVSVVSNGAKLGGGIRGIGRKFT